MSDKIILEEGSLSGLEFDLKDQAEWTLGRDPDLSSLVVEDPSVSRKQLLLQKTSEGILLKNLSETSPTFVNGEEASEPILLKDGDKVSIGNQTFRFVEEGFSNDDDHMQEEAYDLRPTQDTPNEDTAAGEAKDASSDATPEDLLAAGAILNNETSMSDSFEDENSTPMENEMTGPNSPSTSVDEELSHDSIFEEEKNISLPNNGLAQINFDLLDSGRYLLKVIGGPNNGAEFSIQSGETYLIGTDPNTCDIVFHDTSVSRQHAKIMVGEEDQVEIEDLKSRNGVLLDGKAITEKTAIPSSSVVTVGTTSFVIYDREGNMQTIISPLLPEIVKVLNKEDNKSQEALPPPLQEAPLFLPPPEKKEKPLGAFIAIAIITGLFVLMAIGLTSLFRSEPIELVDTSNADTQIADALKSFPGVTSTYSKSTGRLLIVGHVLTQADRDQLKFNLDGLKFIKNPDYSGVVIDELVWQSMNSILNRTPAWRGISIQSPAAGRFLLTGYLQNRKQAEQLYDYVAANFPYIDRLERNIVIDEDVVQGVTNTLANNGIRSVNVQFSDGVLTLTGGVPAAKQDVFIQLQDEFKKSPGVRQLNSQVANLVTDQSTMNISDRYEVSGYSKQGNTINVIINGRIVTKSDTLDGMTIKSISPNTILLEKDGVPYRIDYNR